MQVALDGEPVDIAEVYADKLRKTHSAVQKQGYHAVIPLPEAVVLVLCDLGEQVGTLSFHSESWAAEALTISRARVHAALRLTVTEGSLDILSLHFSPEVNEIHPK